MLEVEDDERLVGILMRSLLFRGMIVYQGDTQARLFYIMMAQLHRKGPDLLNMLPPAALGTYPSHPVRANVIGQSDLRLRPAGIRVEDATTTGNLCYGKGNAFSRLGVSTAI